MSEVVLEIRNLWPECRMVHGSPHHSESNGGIVRVNRTFQEKLHAWMVKHQSKRWSVGCHLVQWQINTQFHHTVQNVPYVLMFGQKPRVGISDLPLDKTVIDKLHTEAELNMVVDVNNEIELPAINGGDHLIASAQSITSASPLRKNKTNKTVASTAAAAVRAMEPPQLDLVRCDWSAVVDCMTSLPLPIHCQVEGCNTLVHHVYQGTWDVLPCAAHIIPVSPPITMIRCPSRLIRLSPHLHQEIYMFDINPLVKSNHVFTIYTGIWQSIFTITWIVASG